MIASQPKLSSPGECRRRLDDLSKSPALRAIDAGEPDPDLGHLALRSQRLLDRFLDGARGKCMAATPARMSTATTTPAMRSQRLYFGSVICVNQFVQSA
jgi:hypothetical protein